MSHYTGMFSNRVLLYYLDWPQIHYVAPLKKLFFNVHVYGVCENVGFICPGIFVEVRADGSLLLFEYGSVD